MMAWLFSTATTVNFEFVHLFAKEKSDYGFYENY